MERVRATRPEQAAASFVIAAANAAMVSSGRFLRGAVRNGVHASPLISPAFWFTTWL